MCLIVSCRLSFLSPNNRKGSRRRLLHILLSVFRLLDCRRVTLLHSQCTIIQSGASRTCCIVLGQDALRG